MKWALIIVGVLVGLGLLATIAGLLLPKGHVATRRARYKASPENIWAALTDFAGQAAWRKDLKRIERLPDRDGHAVWNEIGSQGAMPLETLEVVPPRRLVRKIADPKLPFGGTWTYELEPAAGGGTQLTITEDGEVYNPIFRLVSQFMDMGATMNGFMAALGNKFGESVTPEKIGEK